MVEKILVRNESETKKIGAAIASKAKAGDVVALIGDLGTGKTALTKYIAEELGVDETVTSPTFTIINEYKSGRLPLYHFDVFRLAGEEEMRSLGYEEYFYGAGVSIVEWADKVAGLIPEGSTVVRIEYGADESGRVFEVARPGKR